MSDEMENRFLAKVKKTESCWLWMGAKTPTGYGKIAIRHGLIIYAHRYSYEIDVGPIPKGMFVLHSCDVPSCVFPKHLSVGTHQDNLKDASLKHRWQFGKIGTWEISPMKAKKPNWTLTKEEIAKVKELGKTHSTRAISMMTGVSKSHVHYLVKQ